MNTPFDAMQAAVDIVLTSPHATSKVAASLFSETAIVARTNHWPERISTELGTEKRIGNSSGTVHAEVQCVLDFPEATQGASLCVTDPFCPNCAKNIAEAGIKTIYIDHKGFDKDFAQRRGSEFGSMSLRIAARAGISIYEVNRKERKITPILEIPADYKAPEDNPIKLERVHGLDLPLLVRNVKVIAPRWACGYARDPANNLYALTASAHAAIGYTEHDPEDREKISQPEGKYNFYLEPMTRLMMGASRHGLKLVDGQVWASCIPTAREQVNMVADRLSQIYVGDLHLCRDADGIDARLTLEGVGILKFISLD
jgi:dCMP deaminase